MKHPRMRSMLVSLALVGAPLGIATPALAAPSSPTAQSVVAHQAAATSEGEQDRVVKYWTAERMSSAVPAGVGASAGKASLGMGTAATSKQQALNADPEQPKPKLGKVFFTLGGTDYVCSGTATNSGNHDVVTTAGHCVNEGPGDYATHFAFVPAYDNGDRPYGTWTAESLYTTKAWANSGDFNYDVGFAVLNENSNGKSLGDVVGSYPIGFNLQRGLTYTSYGYPAGSPFDGEQLYSCTDSASQDPQGSQDQGITCDMTGGSSGGGWITNGKLNSVNSFKYNADQSTMYGPYFGDVIKKTYQQAAAA